MIVITKITNTKRNDNSLYFILSPIAEGGRCEAFILVRIFWKTKPKVRKRKKKEKEIRLQIPSWHVVRGRPRTRKKMKSERGNKHCGSHAPCVALKARVKHNTNIRIKRSEWTCSWQWKCSSSGAPHSHQLPFPLLILS